MPGQPAPRSGIPREILVRVLTRDGLRCRYCGVGVADDDFHLDHVVPVSQGGVTSEPNLVVACRPCNRLKGTEAWQPRPLLAQGVLGAIEVLQSQGYASEEAVRRHARVEAGRQARSRRRAPQATATAMNNRIREFRDKHGWTQADLARELNTSRQTVNALEAGRWDPSLPLAFSLSRLFDIAIEERFQPAS